MDPYENDCCASLRAELASAGVYPPAGQSPNGLWTAGSIVTGVAGSLFAGTEPWLAALGVLATMGAEFLPSALSPQEPTPWADLEGTESFATLADDFDQVVTAESDNLGNSPYVNFTTLGNISALQKNLATIAEGKDISVKDIADLEYLLKVYNSTKISALDNIVKDIGEQVPPLLVLTQIASQNPELADLTQQALPILHGYEEQLALLTLASVPNELDAISSLLQELTPDEFANLAQNRSLIVDLAEGAVAQEDLTTSAEEAGTEIELYNYAMASPEFVSEMADSRVLYPFISELLASENVQAVIAEQMFTAPTLEGESTVFDEALEGAARRAMGMDEVAEKPEWMPDFLWGVGQGLFGQSLTEKPEDMSDEEWAALTGAWDTGQKAFGVDENPLEQMQMDVDDLKTTVPGMESDIAQAKTMAQDAVAVKGTANSALSVASQALRAAEAAREIAESALLAAAAAGGTRPGADSPDVDRPPGAGGWR